MFQNIDRAQTTIHLNHFPRLGAGLGQFFEDLSPHSPDFGSIKQLFSTLHRKLVVMEKYGSF
jgi:hypothetical protein